MPVAQHALIIFDIEFDCLWYNADPLKFAVYLSRFIFYLFRNKTLTAYGSYNVAIIIQHCKLALATHNYFLSFS